MLGQLPARLDVVGKLYDIRADFRNILRIFMAFEDEDMNEQEKAYVFLKRMYPAFESIPEKDYRAAYDAAFVFIECNAREDKPSPRVVNWEKDEQMIFPAINKVAGMEVRAVPFLHWWTFLGHFQSIDHESLWGGVLTIRQKKAKGKKLEKHEQEFYRSNKALCEVGFKKALQVPEDKAQAIFDSLLEE